MDIDGTVQIIRVFTDLYWSLFRNFGIVYVAIVFFRRLAGV